MAMPPTGGRRWGRRCVYLIKYLTLSRHIEKNHNTNAWGFSAKKIRASAEGAAKNYRKPEKNTAGRVLRAEPLAGHTVVTVARLLSCGPFESESCHAREDYLLNWSKICICIQDGESEKNIVATYV